jgi:pilus assembly protein CpaE
MSDPEGSLQWSTGGLDGTNFQTTALPPRNPRTITMFSPKGGVGTTFLAVNVAVALAERGRRRVCIVDLDLEFGDVGIVAGVAPNRDISDAAGEPLEEDETINSVLTNLSPGVDCVLAPIDPATADNVSPDLVVGLLARLRERYDYIIVDTPCHLSEPVLEVLDISDHHVLVTTPSVPALKNMRLLLDTLDLLGTDESVRAIVLNQVDGKDGLRRADVEEILGNPIAAELPSSPDVPDSIDVGRPLVSRRRETAVSVALRAFVADTLLQESVSAGRPTRRLGLITRKRSL